VLVIVLASWQAVIVVSRYQPPPWCKPTQEGMDHLESSPDRSGTLYMFHWGLNDSPEYVCGKPQTAQDIIYHCAILEPLKEVDLAYSSEATSHWLKQLEGIT